MTEYKLNHWICVEDKLPSNPTKEVLAWCGYHTLARYSDDKWLVYYSDKYAENTGWTEEHNVSHWQPLPEPPKEF